MYVFIIIFMVFAFLMGLFCAGLTVRDVVIDAKDRKKAKNASELSAETVEAPTVAIKEKSVIDSVAVTEQAKEETVTTEVETDEDAVTFSAGFRSLDEKYLMLSSDVKGYYDEVVRFAMGVENSKRYKNSAYEEYKVGKNRIVRLKIRRGVLICELVIPNLTFKNYISDNKVAVKQAPATIKVVDEASLNSVKDSIDIAVKAIEEEKAYKKEQAKLRRRQNRAAAKESTDSKE